jgi:hypothetical protein
VRKITRYDKGQLLDSSTKRQKGSFLGFVFTKILQTQHLGTKVRLARENPGQVLLRFPTPQVRYILLLILNFDSNTITSTTRIVCLYLHFNYYYHIPIDLVRVRNQIVYNMRDKQGK